ncbi:MAG TPA: hypothetical protein DCQ90_05455 [Erysipelotrichaceae bacterium]|nr:hypothetical protein [Erysipelotrichaceae bacterium]
MKPFNDDVVAYTEVLRDGKIQRAYRGILEFMSSLRSRLEQNHPDHFVSALYAGYLDMTYFAFTPSILKERRLKIAIVYLHPDHRFEVWLGAINRNVQKETLRQLEGKDIFGYKRGEIKPGEDAILSSILVDHPDFDTKEKLENMIEEGTLTFIQDVVKILNDSKID